jgi:thiol:disulfide interchange protein DsbD
MTSSVSLLIRRALQLLALLIATATLALPARAADDLLPPEVRHR